MTRLRLLLPTALLLATAVPVLAGPWTVPPGRPGPLGREVDPRHGTGGLPWASGSTSPAAQVPFGMVQLGPDTAPLFGPMPGGMRTSGYYHGDRLLRGFSHTRLSGTGVAEGGLFRVVPLTGRATDAHRRGRKRAAFTHAGERAHPGDYAVALPLERVLVELTATTRVGVHRYTFEPGRAAALLLHASSALGARGRTRDPEVRLLPATGELEGSCVLLDGFSGRQGGVRAYFAARVDPPPAAWGTWIDAQVAPGGLHALGPGEGRSVGAELSWPAAPGRRAVTLTLALSFVSAANARLNLAAEAPPGTTFDDVRDRATRAWEDALGRARVTGGTAERRTIFATSLYRSQQMPTTWSDVNGEFTGFDGRTHVAHGWTYYTNLSLWDTFRTQHPLLALIAPDVQQDVVRSLVEMARHGNGYLPRWAAANACTGSMFGSPADIVISESWQKGLRAFDAASALEAMKRGATSPAPPGGPARGREGVDEYVRHGYGPSDRMHEAVSRTLEYAWADHAIGRLAAGLGQTADAARFLDRGRWYANTWNPATRHFQPRRAAGGFETPFVPGLLSYLDVTPGRRLTHAFVEGSPRQWRFSAFHDPQGLAALFGGRDALTRDLEDFLAGTARTRGAAYPGPDYWHGNEHDLHAAWLFCWTGRPDLTQRWVRTLLDEKYGPGPRGLDGQDDAGTLSAWYVLAALGVYPVAGTDTYAVGSPLFDRADVALGGGRALTVIADRQGPGDRYVQSLTINGAPHLVPWVQHAALEGVVRFALAPAPTSWGR